METMLKLEKSCVEAWKIFFTQEMLDDCVFANNIFSYGIYGNTTKMCDIIERVADLPKKEEKIPHKCTCDFQTVILRYGCQCGGK